MNPDGCGCMYQKRKNKKKIVPLSASLLPPPPPSLPSNTNMNLQLQQPRRFTRKLYNPNSTSNFNHHYDPMVHFPQSPPNIHYTDIPFIYDNVPNGCGIRVGSVREKRAEDIHAYSEGHGRRSPEEYAVPLLYLDQLIRTHEEINHQEPLALSRQNQTHTSRLSKGELTQRVLNQHYSNNLASRKIRNRQSISSMKDRVNLFQHNLPYNHYRDFDKAFLHHIHYLMSFKNRISQPNFSVLDDQHSIIAQAEPFSITFNESASEYRPATLPSDNGALSFYSV